MDGFVTDGILNPEDGEERFSETVLRLPCFYLHMPIEDVSLQRRAGEPFTMGSCNNPAKLNDRVIELWSQVLKVIPGSRLMLKYRDSFSDPALVEDFGRRFAAQGIDASRVILDGRRVGRGEHLAFVGQLDVALDPFPFNGSTTTYEALWMGVPVVTLAGRRFVGRVGAAMLHQVGLPDLVAGSLSEYVEIVVRLASDGPRRALLRTDLRRRLLASALMNAPAYARNVEAMYRQMWRRWCGSRSAT
jgi:predicted O-linked N-acetylglucosamine transferase (SPINDLY family)